MKKVIFIKDEDTYHNITEVSSIQFDSGKCYVDLRNGTNIIITSEIRMSKIKELMNVI